MKPNKTSQWAGYSASFFSIIYFALAITIGIAESRHTKPMLLYTAMGLAMSIAALSGVVCLVSAIRNSLKDRKNSN